MDNLKTIFAKWTEEGYDMANAFICVVWSGNDIFVGNTSADLANPKKGAKALEAAASNVKELRKIGDQFPHLVYIAAGNGKCWNEGSFDDLMAPLLTELSKG